MHVVNLSEACNKLNDVIDRVSRDGDVTVISRPDAADAVIMSLDHYNSLIETMYLLQSPANAAQLARSIGRWRTEQARLRNLDDEEHEASHLLLLEDACRGLADVVAGQVKDAHGALSAIKRRRAAKSR
ncbi:type II toxin-antitoxin system Phd/YefM family antitoxin [Noviherbaspirillum pedocola]|uniref:Antitoxin n=1 Tax=Noviherbaspirillum pedocola TaxID=2801341 RepID=A0A934SP17_9BURK|nr:type II toxin-antitoxin system Phd/YefM family antitoxin [Noviherbaspirillum pedocola]MBK4733980.1 type II toxin-antitoxin system Phd/YefM family antitoxin [Noviherbaspirillum pedocola]